MVEPSQNSYSGEKLFCRFHFLSHLTIIVFFSFLNYRLYFFLFRISDYMDLTPVDIVGKRCYHFIHAEDVEGIRHSHLDCKYFYFYQNNLVQNQIVTQLLFIFHDWGSPCCSYFFFFFFLITGFHRGWLKHKFPYHLFSNLSIDI